MCLDITKYRLLVLNVYYLQVSKKLAECVGLHDGATLYLRALTDVANAVSVEVEPATEDDWEILELNAGFVEDHILSQVLI